MLKVGCHITRFQAICVDLRRLLLIGAAIVLYNFCLVANYCVKSFQAPLFVEWTKWSHRDGRPNELADGNQVWVRSNLRVDTHICQLRDNQAARIHGCITLWSYTRGTALAVARINRTISFYQGRNRFVLILRTDTICNPHREGQNVLWDTDSASQITAPRTTRNAMPYQRAIMPLRANRYLLPQASYHMLYQALLRPWAEVPLAMHLCLGYPRRRMHRMVGGGFFGGKG